MKTIFVTLHHRGSAGDMTRAARGRQGVEVLFLRLLLATVLPLPACKAHAGATFTSLYSFTGGDDGANPVAALVQASDGYFYGTTEGGGACSNGTVFKVSAGGALTSLYSFTGTNDGANPFAGLVEGNDGLFYGTTLGGGYGYGTIFNISTNGALTSLYWFSQSDGAAPRARLVQGKDGYFYGTTANGGNYGRGTVFKISATGDFTSLSSFDTPGSGVIPYSGLVQGNDGFFYGTTFGFVAPPFGRIPGSVYKISADGTLTALTLLYGADGLVQGRDGFLYGTTLGGGYGYGTIFNISTQGGLTNLHSFTASDGAYPRAGLMQGRDGFFYGTTMGGGSSSNGTVFQISATGVLTTLHSFTGTNDGADPYSGLVQGADGNFYGMTYYGGAYGFGTIFRMTIQPAFEATTLTNETLTLTWSTEAGAKYQLQWASNLDSSSWSNFGGPITGTGAVLSATDSITNGPRRFYQVVLLP